MKTLTFIYELIKFTLISVPLACLLYVTTILLSKIKQLCTK